MRCLCKGTGLGGSTHKVCSKTSNHACTLTR